MAYRFTMKQSTVECDSLEELLAALPAPDVTPTTAARRASTVSAQPRSPKDELPVKKKRRTNPVAVESWRLAKAYGAHRGIPPKQARSEIAASRRKMNKAIEIAGPA